MKIGIIHKYFGSENIGIPKFAEIGFDCIEIPRKNHPSRVMQVTNEELIQLCKSYGVEPLSMIGNDMFLVSKDPTKRKKAVEDLKGDIVHANFLGSKIIEIVPGWGTHRWGETEKYDDMEEMRKQVIEVLKPIGKFAEDYGVVLVLEPCSVRSTRHMPTIRDAVKIAREVSSDSVKVMGDTTHMIGSESDPVQAILDAKGWIAHMHFADSGGSSSGRLLPGFGNMNLKSIIRALSQIGYDGILSLAEVRPFPETPTEKKQNEYYEKILEKALASSHKYLRSILRICDLEKSSGKY